MATNLLIKSVQALASTMLLSGLVACGGGGSTGGTGTSVNVSSSTTTTTTSTSTTPTMTVSLSASSVVKGSPIKATATFANVPKGAAVSGILVTFSTDGTKGTLSPASGAAITDSTGTATISLDATSLTADAATLSVSGALIDSTGASVTATGSAAYSVGATNVVLATISTGVGAATLSAFGTTSVTVNVTANGVAFTQPVTVNFTSTCAGQSKATLPASATTLNGVATVTYLDNGCASVVTSDTVTATLSGVTGAGASKTVQIASTLPAAGSIKFVSAAPASVTLKGTGGFGLQETSKLTFQVVNQAGTGVSGVNVALALTTTSGGITMDSGSTTLTKQTDAAGNVSVNVNAGNLPTPVRVVATTTTAGGTLLTTQSDQLVISTGLPIQRSFSLSFEKFNIEGWNIDGQTSKVTARLADYFGNPVPNGTAVSFVTEGGSIGSVPASCVTTDGACTVTLTSQNFRPADGRVTVLAYGLGVGTFADANANGICDGAEVATPLGVLYVDNNEDGVQQASETTIPFSTTTTPPAGACANWVGFVRGSGVVTFSAGTLGPGVPATVASLSCAGGASGSFSAFDLNNNPLPVGTTVGIANAPTGVTANVLPATVANTNAVGGTGHTVSVTQGCVAGAGFNVVFTSPSGIVSSRAVRMVP